MNWVQKACDRVKGNDGRAEGHLLPEPALKGFAFHGVRLASRRRAFYIPPESHSLLAKRHRDEEPPMKRSTVTGGHRAQVRPIGVIRSRLKSRGQAPKQGREGAPDAWLEVSAFAAEGLEGIVAGSDLVVVTWLHRARRDVLRVHPRSDRRRPMTGVFATRSPDRPNPLGLHRVTVRRRVGNRLRIGPIEALDGTPVIDIKPVLGGPRDF
jgi:tRNA-Thr(GGU) m(6)t(6)A37 methyltransferase TsaA